MKELYLVMKPVALMVSTLSIESVEMGKRRGFINTGDINPERFMDSLKMHDLLTLAWIMLKLTVRNHYKR